MLSNGAVLVTVGYAVFSGREDAEADEKPPPGR